MDFATLDGKLVVEVDGVTHGEPSEVLADQERTHVLNTCGFHVVRVSNQDIYDNMDGVLDMIELTLNND